MGRTCTICNSSKRLEIDRALCQGKGYQNIANDTGESAQAIRRHWESGHINYQLQTAMQNKDVLEGQNLLGEIESLISRTKTLLETAEDAAKNKRASSLNAAFKGIDSLRGHYELLSKIAFSLHSARMQELEIQQRQDGTKRKEEEEEHMQKIRNLFTDAELHLYEKLLEKLELEDPEMSVVEEYRDSEEMEFLRSFEREDWSKRGHVGEVTADKHRPTPLHERDPEPVPEVHDNEEEEDDEDEPEPEPDPKPKGGMHRTKPPAKRGQSEEEDPRPKCEREMKPKDPPKTSVQRVLREFD